MSDRHDVAPRHTFHALPVVDIVDETADTRTLTFNVPDEIADLYRYAAGQFCAVRGTIDGQVVSRCYSMSSAPAVDDRLAVTVKRVPGGVMSNWLHDHVTIGDELELMPPSGVFCERPGEAPILAFSGGSGVTPIFSIVKQVLATGGRRVRVLDANRDHHNVIFRDELDRLTATHPDRLAVRHHLDAESGFLTADDIAAFVGDDTDAHVFVCGPTPFMDVVEEGLARAGIPPEHVTIERFVNSAVLDAPAPGDDRGEGTTEQLTIVFKRKRHETSYVAGDTVLETARRAGLRPPFSCEQGNCATCMALVIEGAVSMRANNVLTDDEVAEGWVLTCQGLPVGPVVTVEYEDL